ncbi:MAG: DUF86 domain-containing protein [Anaerolineae bacterium]|nr:DUF86 domain-containing protein [Anaerolineae bacterium]
MVDPEKLRGLIERLRQYTGYLREIVQQDEVAYLNDPRSVGSARYYLQVSVETCINIANHIIASEGLRSPHDYKDSFTVLNEAGVLPNDLTRRLRDLAGLRNLLVHVYWEVDDRMVYRGIRAELGDFDAFIGWIARLLQ